KTSPRYYHRPCLDTAHAINSIFGGNAFNEVVEIVASRLFAHALNLDCPGLGSEILCPSSRVILTSSEFVVIVVRGDVFEGSWFFRSVVLSLCLRCRERRNSRNNAAYGRESQ